MRSELINRIPKKPRLLHQVNNPVWFEAGESAEELRGKNYGCLVHFPGEA
jgi:hypothetical protein